MNIGQMVFAGGTLLFCVYLLVLWGSVLLKSCYGYVYDGEKEGWDLVEYFEDKFDILNSESLSDRVLSGFLAYTLLFGLVYFGALMVISLLMKCYLMQSIYVVITMVIVIFLLRIARFSVRLNRKLELHTSDKSVHK